MTLKERIPGLISTLPIVMVLGVGLMPMTPTLSVDEPASATLKAEQQELVDWAEDRFARAGLSLPRVEYRFHDHPGPCGGHRGLYHHRLGLVEVCSFYADTVIHELSHAWTETNLTDADKLAFLTLRGLTTWNDHTQPWDRRGIEQAAEVITWAVEERTRLVPWTDTDGCDTHRLLSIPGSTPTELADAYRLLTGLEPASRNPDEWQVAGPSTSPEAVRAGSRAAAPVEHPTTCPAETL